MIEADDLSGVTRSFIINALLILLDDLSSRAWHIGTEQNRTELALTVAFSLFHYILKCDVGYISDSSYPCSINEFDFYDYKYYLKKI